MKLKKYKLKCHESHHQRIIVNEKFVKKNKFTLNRTQKEIFERIKKESENPFSFSADVLIDYLDWEKSKQFYKNEYIKKVKDKKEKKPTKITDIYETVQDMLDYLIFGYMKALDERGLSAGRTIDKLSHWLWLLGREDLKRLVNDNELYNPYGMPALIELTKALGLKVPEDCIEFAKHKC